MPKLVKASEVRKLLDLESDARVYGLARSAILPGVVRIGRQIRFDIDKILQFVEAGGRVLPAGWRRAATVDGSRHPPDDPLSSSPQSRSDTAPAVTVSGGKE